MSSSAKTAPTTMRGLWRWLVALVATVLMVVAGSGLVVFAQSGSGASQGPVYLPEDTPIYLEVRLDMPDGQGDALAQFMTAFPGFADVASFPTKSEEIIGAIMDMVGDEVPGIRELGGHLTGEVGLGMTDLSAAAMESDSPPVLVGLAIDDRAAVEELVAGMTAGTPEAYGGASIYTGEDTYFGVHDAWLLISPHVEQVQAGVDVLEGASPSLADDPDFQTAIARVPPAHLAALYFDLASFGPLIEGAIASTDMSAFGMSVEDMLGQLPLDMVAYLAAEADRATLEAFITPAPGSPAVSVGESELATLFPPDTQVYIETRALGATLGTLVETLMATMDEEAAAQIAPIEDMLGAPLPEILDFISDTSIGAALSSDGLWLGIAAEVADVEAASERLDTLLALLRVIGASEDSGITVETETIDSTDVTTVTLPLEDMTAGAGLPFPIAGSLSIALTDDTLLVGLGDFVETALTQSVDDSLGSSEGYADALGADTTNGGVLYVDIGSLVTELDPLLASMVPEWPDAQPFVAALDRLIAVSTAVEDVLDVRFTLIAGH